MPIRHGSDHRRALEILERVAAEEVGEYVEQAEREWKDLVRRFRIKDARLASLVTLVATENWIDLTLRYVVGYRARRAAKDRLFRRILDEMAATEGKIQLASTTFEVVGVPPLEVKLRAEKAPRCR